MSKPTLSDTALAILAGAATRANRAASPPEHLPVAAQRVVVRSLLKAGLLEEIAAEGDQVAWRTDDAGQPHALRLTPDGVAAITAAAEPETGGAGPGRADAGIEAGQAPEPPQTVQEAPPAPVAGNTRLTLRAASHAILVAWDAEDRLALATAFERLRSALAGPGTRARRVRLPRTDTKRAAVLTLLRRPEGTTVAQVAEATGWARHTVHGFFAGLKKQGTRVEVLDRVRQVGAGQGAKSSYTVYRIVEAG